jgi:polysaccharide biosynthesis transport protein
MASDINELASTRNNAGEPPLIGNQGSTDNGEKVASSVGLPAGSPWRALQRRWFLALFVGLLLGSIAACSLCFLWPAKFTSFALIRVESERPELLPRDRVVNDLELYRMTQTALIKSPKVLDAALRQEKAQQLSIVAERYDPVSWLENALVVEPIHNTELLRVALSGQNAEDTATLINAIVQSYLQEVVNRDQRQRSERLMDLKGVLERTEEKLRGQRKKLQGVAESLKTSDPETATLRQKIALEEYVALRKELITLGSELRQVAKIKEADSVRAAGSESAFPSPTAVLEQTLDDHPEVLLQAKKVAHLEETLTQTKATALPGFRGITEAETALTAAKEATTALRARLRRNMEEKVKQRLEAEAQILAAKQGEREGLLKEQFENIRKEAEECRSAADRIGLAAILYETERSGSQQTDKIIKSLQAERERLEVEGRSSVQRVTVEVEATPPLTRSRKGQILVASVGGLASFLAGLLGVTYWEYRSRRVYSREEVVQGLRLRVLGCLPLLGQRNTQQPGQVKNNAYRPASLWAEAMTGLRTVILHEANLHAIKVILITSAKPQEGKTTLANHLAISLAAAGRRTLLIDADLRCPVLHTLFGTRQGPGLSDVLLGKCDSAAAIQTTSTPGLALLPAGVFRDTVPDLLAQGRLEILLQPLRSQYDAIVLDSSPILAVNDALLLSRHVDAVVLSIRPDRSQTPMVYEACEQLRALDVPVLGTVLNGTSNRLPGRVLNYE